MTISEWFSQVPEQQVCKWSTWKEEAKSLNIVVDKDDSGRDDNESLGKADAFDALNKCTVTVVAENVQQKINDWAAEYDLLVKTPPANGDFLQTCDGSRVKLEVIKILHKSPFISTRAYVPDIIGSPLGWFVTGEYEIRTHGWRVILGTLSRNECIKRFGLAADNIFVKSLRVLRISQDGQSIVAEVAEWD